MHIRGSLQQKELEVCKSVVNPKSDVQSGTCFFQYTSGTFFIFLVWLELLVFIQQTC